MKKNKKKLQMDHGSQELFDSLINLSNKVWTIPTNKLVPKFNALSLLKKDKSHGKKEIINLAHWIQISLIQRMQREAIRRVDLQDHFNNAIGEGGFGRSYRTIA